MKGSKRYPPVSAMAQPDPRVATNPAHRMSCLWSENSPSSVDHFLREDAALLVR